VVHRDLKPSNILIEDLTDIPVLTDFGLAKLIDAEHNVTLSDEAFGSPPYMGARAADARHERPPVPLISTAWGPRFIIC